MQITSELFCTHEINMQITSELFCAHEINMQITSELFCTHEINMQITSELFCTHEINMQITSQLFCTHEINMQITSQLICIYFKQPYQRTLPPVEMTSSPVTVVSVSRWTCGAIVNMTVATEVTRETVVSWLLTFNSYCMENCYNHTHAMNDYGV